MTAGNTTSKNKTSLILADGRWLGEHGIGRFSAEIFSHLKNCTVITSGPKPLSIKNLFWLPFYLFKNRKNYNVYFNPGFNALLYSPIPFVFVIHDLNHLHFPDSGRFFKKLYYNYLIKWTAKRANKILTVSDYSKKTILDWTGLPEDNVIVISSGISKQFTEQGNKHQPDYPYLLHVGNTKTHKNVERLIEAFAKASIDPSIKLILTGQNTATLAAKIHQLKLNDRILFSGSLSETQLAEYYRGALAITYPSLYEGFGLPILEGMASGVPVLTANVTSMPEIAKDAALLVNPFSVDSIKEGISSIVNNTELREQLIQKGRERIIQFSWEKVAHKVQTILDSIKK
jgi:glycosyltransferase involved in cell wall biosynthesis